MGNKGELKYISFAENLNERISSANAKTAKYDAPSVCGQQSCGSVYRDNQALGCITGASYAEVYCLRNNMGNCSEMKNDIVQNCRDSFCSTY